MFKSIWIFEFAEKKVFTN